MALPEILTKLFPPSPVVLLDLARHDLDDATLMAIARADYGYLADEAFTQLCLIRQTGAISTQSTFQLWEVLALTRWCDPDTSESTSDLAGRRGHRARLFACAVLLRTLFDLGDDDDAIDSTWAKCLVSAGALGDSFAKAIASFATWRYLKLQHPHDALWLAMVLLVSSLRLEAGLVPDSVIEQIADWVLTHEELSWNDRSSNPRPLPFSIAYGFWLPVVAELDQRCAKIETAAVREKVQLCSLFINP